MPSKSAGCAEDPPRPRAARLKPEERRAQLIASAMRVFACRGINGASHTEVAREAKVAVSTVFVYFPTRKALVTEVLDTVEREHMELATTVHAAQQPVPEILRAHMAGFAAMVEDRPDQVQVWLHWSSSVAADTWPRYSVFQDRAASLLAGTIARGQREGDIDGKLTPHEVAHIVISIAYPIALMKLSGRPQQEVERLMSTFTQVITGGPASAVAA